MFSKKEKDTPSSDAPELPLATVKDILLRGVRERDALKHAAEAVAVLENLEDAIGNTRTRLEDIQGQERAALDNLQEAQSKVDAAKADAKDVVAKAKQDADAEKAAGIKAIDDHKTALEWDLVELNNAISIGKEELETVTAAIVAARADLDEVTKQIEQVKASVQSIGAK